MSHAFWGCEGMFWVRAGRRGACLTGTDAADVSSLATLVSTKSSVSEGEDGCDHKERSVFRRTLDGAGPGWTQELVSIVGFISS